MGLIALEYLCDHHGRFASTEERATAPDAKPCPECGESSPYVISAPSVRMQYATVSRGTPGPPPFPAALDTRPLAEGMSMSEWRGKRAKIRDDLRRAEIRSKI